MPELPEVETIVRDLQKKLVGQNIKKTTVLTPKTVAPLEVEVFINQTKNATILKVSRRAKIINLTLNKNKKESHLLCHLKMTGQLILKPKTGPLVTGGHPQKNGATFLPNNFTRLIFNLKNGDTLYFNDMRKFGWMRLVSFTEKETTLNKYGVEPLTKDFTPLKLENIFSRFPRRSIKKALFDQHQIAGLGNIYIDEACFLSGLKPDRIVSTLNKKEIEKLRNNIIYVLKLSIKNRGTSAKNYLTALGTPGDFVKHLNVYGLEKNPCKTCGTPIVKIKHAGRGTHFCPKCQK